MLGNCAGTQTHTELDHLIPCSYRTAPKVTSQGSFQYDLDGYFVARVHGAGLDVDRGQDGMLRHYAIQRDFSVRGLSMLEIVCDGGGLLGVIPMALSRQEYVHIRLLMLLALITV